MIIINLDLPKGKQVKQLVLILIATCLWQGGIFTQITTDTTRIDSTRWQPTDQHLDPLYQEKIKKNRKWRMPLVFTTTAGLYVGSFIGLNELS